MLETRLWPNASNHQQHRSATSPRALRNDRDVYAIRFLRRLFQPAGWKEIGSYIELWPGGEGHCCGLLIGMAKLPQDELFSALSFSKRDGEIDNQTALRLEKRLAEEFREQLAIDIPTNTDEIGLRRHIS